MSIVSRYRCYDSLEAQKEFHSSNNKLTLDDVLEMLLNVSTLNDYRNTVINSNHLGLGTEQKRLDPDRNCQRYHENIYTVLIR